MNLAGGVRLDYWDLALVSTGPPGQAGVLSVRTGRVLFLAAGIAEPVHFARPFGLTWGELLADGNLGQLFFDLNDWGQRLDGLPFHPDALQLSPFVAGANPTLAVSGVDRFPVLRRRLCEHRGCRGRSARARHGHTHAGSSRPSPRSRRPRGRPISRLVGNLARRYNGQARRVPVRRRARGLQHHGPARLPGHGRRRVRLPALLGSRHHGRDPGGGYRHPHQRRGDARPRSQHARTSGHAERDRRERPHRRHDHRVAHDVRSDRAECRRPRRASSLPKRATRSRPTSPSHRPRSTSMWRATCCCRSA